MSSKVSPIATTDYSSNDQSAPQKPIFKIGRPYDLGGARWVPVRTRFKDEVCEIHATFPINSKSQELGITEAGTEILSYPLDKAAFAYECNVKDSAYIVTRCAINEIPGVHSSSQLIHCSSQFILCFLLGVEGRQVPEYYADFQELVLRVLDGMDPSTKTFGALVMQEIEVPNCNYFALRATREPTIASVEFPHKEVLPNGKVRVVEKTTLTEKGGLIIHAYATQEALYVLVNKKQPHDSDDMAYSYIAETFLASFRLNP